MPLQIVRNDITKMRVDAVVNAANASLLGGGGVDGALHRAAGPRLWEACAALGGCATGCAKITKGYDLPCKYVIHTVGPVWIDGRHGEPALLASCYNSSLELAKSHRCESVAFPLISSGSYGCPKDQALKIAVDTIGGFLLHNDMTAYIVVFDRQSFQIGGKLFANVSAYIDEEYVEEHTESRSAQLRRMPPVCAAYSVPDSSANDMDSLFDGLDESFAQALFRKIDERHMTDVECYKRANVDRKLFSKIKGNKNYQPSKPTVAAFCIALRLSPDETRDLLMKAGFALSRSNRFDIIIEYCVLHEIWNVNEVNEILFRFDQSLLGSF